MRSREPAAGARRVSAATWRSCRVGARCWLLATLLVASGLASAEGLRLELSRLDHPLVTLEGVRLSIGSEAEVASLSVARADIAGLAFDGLELTCPRLELAEGSVKCHGGSLELPGVVGRASIDFDFDPAGSALQFRLVDSQGETLELGLFPDGTFQARFEQVDVARIVGFVPALGAYSVNGRLSGSAQGGAVAGSASSTFDIRLKDGGFDSAGGLNAAEGLGFELSGRLLRRDHRWDGRAAIRWTAGEAYLHPVYLTAGPSVHLAGSFDGSHLRLDELSLEIDGVDAIDLEAEFITDPLQLVSASGQVQDADLGELGGRYLIPLLAPELGERLQLGGAVSVGARYESGELKSLDMVFADVSASLDSGMFGVGPLTGTLPWRAFEPVRARFDVSAANWEELALGAFSVEARLHGDTVDFDPISVPVLDGRLVVSDLSLERRHDGWHGQGGAFIEPLSMESLTVAVGLPAMSGLLSASLPALLVRPGSLSIDGSLVISVFDGYVRVSRLELREPFGVAAYLTADLEARNLDLDKITETFAFGNVTGFIDADVLGLELVRWRPVAFDATVRSSPGRYPKRISQRAVQNIGALGGGGAAMALQRGFLGFFESFGYREIGLSCRLVAGVCVMDGIAETAPDGGDGFVIMRGGGIPSLNVIGYNRRVDWQELLARLQAAIASNTAPVIE